MKGQFLVGSQKAHIPRVKLRLHIFFQTVGQESVKYVA